MPDVQPQDTTKPQDSPAIAELAPADDKSIAALTAGLKRDQEAKLRTDTALSAESNAQTAKDKQRREQMFAAEGVAASEIPQKWDAEKEHKRFETNPLEGFGSAGGLFAMVASAFTRSPMESAINGMAGALTAISEGNEAAYQRNYDAFKENVKLAEQRFKTQHELYEDALQLGTANQAAMTAKFHNAAVRFGDKHALTLMDAGYFPELYELNSARAKSFEDSKKYADLATEDAMQKKILKGEYKKIDESHMPPDLREVKKLEAFNRVHTFGKMKTEQQEAMATWAWQHRFDNQGQGPTIEEREQFFDEHFGKSADMERQRNEYKDARWADWQSKHNGEDPPPEEQAKITAEAAALGRGSHAAAAAAGKPALTNARQIQQDAEAYKARMAAEHPDWGPDKLDKERDAYVKRREIETKSPTAADIHKDDVQYQKAERMEGAMTEMEELMLKHKLITGLGGTVTRPFEVASNILGSNATDRKQFQRVATELKEWGTSVVNDRTGRPLSQETKDAAVIFAGLNPGDTGPNTLRAIMELRPVIAKIKEDILARGRGQGPVSGGGTPAPAAKEDGKEPLWKNAPVAQ